MTNPLYDALFAPHAGREAPFLILKDNSKISYAAFLGMAARFAQAMNRSGLEPGDRLVVQVGKSPQALAIYAACIQAGVVLLPLNPAYTPAEVGYFVGNSGARLLLCDPARAEALAGVAQDHGARLMTLDGQGGGSFAQAAADMPDKYETVARQGSDLASLLYTSGTTGRSKGAMMSHDNLLSNARILTELWQFTADDVLLHALPIFHTHGLFVATNIVLLSGGSMRFLPRFDTGDVLAALPRSTAIMGVPTFYTRLLDCPGFTRETAARVRLFVSGSAPLLADTHVAFEARTGHRILERYGMTETCMNSSNPFDGPRKPGTVGPPLRGVEVIVTDPESGLPVQQGEVGMVEVRGPNVFQGYWQMPGKTAQEKRENGFFITGDLGRFDEDGYLVIVGRGKDLIITGGFNVYPKEVELVLDDQPGVLESAVIGAPHREYGEGVLGVLVPGPGDTPDLEAIAARLQTKLAGFKRPKRLVLVDHLPRNTMGKVQKNLLRAQYADIFKV